MRPNIDALLRYPTFADFRPDELASIARVLQVRELQAGEVLFEYGATGSSMFLLDVGRIQIDLPTTPGNFQILATLNPPSVFGEMALLTAEPRSARALAVRPSILWEIERASLEPLAKESHAAGYKTMKWIATQMSSRLRATNERLREIYAKPFKSIQELKAQLEEITPKGALEELGLREDELAIGDNFDLSGDA